MLTQAQEAHIGAQAGWQQNLLLAALHEQIECIMRGELLGTIFHALSSRVTDRKRWILSGVQIPQSF
jgi:glutamate 5-kinase